VTELTDEGAVAAAHVEHLRQHGPVRTLVVANPADVRAERGGLSALAPWVALQRCAALLLTNAAGDDVAAVVRAARDKPRLAPADRVILLADLEAIPMEHRPNPAAGKDTRIATEPLTPAGGEPHTFATGRLFHRDRALVALQLARQRLLAEAR